jgi:proline dehydrogenase
VSAIYNFYQITPSLVHVVAFLRIRQLLYLCAKFILMPEYPPVSFNNTQVAFAGKTDQELNRAYVLFKAIGFNFLVKTGPVLVNAALALRLPIKGLIKSTIFAHFCGGETIRECNKRISELYSYKIGTILDYSVEGKETEQDFDNCVEETIATIHRAKGDPAIPFSVFKVTGLAPFSLLEKLDAKAELSNEEQHQYGKVAGRVDKICRAAYEAGVPVFIDAEESWIQDTVDTLAEAMMEKYNREKAVVYNTIQLYRSDRLAFLRQSVERARGKGYFPGFKLVRGAYMEKERARAEKSGYPSPIQPDKASTDRDYDEALRFCVSHLDQLALCAGTHNEQSSLLLTELMKQQGIEPGDKRIFFSQLLGMSDHISYNLANAGFNVAKYVPYGPVTAVLPYLIRRANENTSISGQTGRELGLIQKEKKRRRS